MSNLLSLERGLLDWSLPDNVEDCQKLNSDGDFGWDFQTDGLSVTRSEGETQVELPSLTPGYVWRNQTVSNSFDCENSMCWLKERTEVLLRFLYLKNRTEMFIVYGAEE